MVEINVWRPWEVDESYDRIDGKGRLQGECYGIASSVVMIDLISLHSTMSLGPGCLASVQQS